MMLIVAVVVLLIGGAAGAVLFMRKRGSDEDASPKEFSHQLIPTQVQPVQQTYQQPVVEQPVQQTYQQPIVEQPVQQTYQQPVVEQPAVVAEPTVLQQWTDEAGYTWRAMDDGTNFWWTGTEWQLR